MELVIPSLECHVQITSRFSNRYTLKILQDLLSGMGDFSIRE